MKFSGALQANRCFTKNNLETLEPHLFTVSLQLIALRRIARHKMAGIDPNARKKYRKLYTPDSAAVRELRLACKANDSKRVRELLDDDSITAEIATACLEAAHPNLSLMRLLLDHGADPAVCAETHYMGESFDLIKLLVEFGYDMGINGHCVLQYVDYISFR